MTPSRLLLRRPRLWRVAVTGLALAAGLPVAAGASADGRALAVDMGCVNCHGTPRGDAPSIERLAQHLGEVRGQPDEVARRAERLRKVNSAHRIVAHEQLSPETASRLVQWLADEAK